VARLIDVARALDASAADLLRDAEGAQSARGRLARSARRRQSSIGPALAERLGVPFVELDRWWSKRRGWRWRGVRLQGEAFYRRLERDNPAALSRRNARRRGRRRW
jgi:hypothetical protein